MKIKDIFDKKRAVLSYEIFPPKKTSQVDTVYSTIENLVDLKPDFISVTYGAGGSVAENKTCELSGFIKEKTAVEPLAHLTCINSHREEVAAMLEQLKARNIENILALRGDRSPDFQSPGDFRYAYELIGFIKEHGDFDICAACYPEGHLESESMKEDIRHLKQKVDAGVSSLVSQLFFDNEDFYRFTELCDIAGIDLPIQAGIMPVTNKKQIERMVSMCGATLPKKFSRVMARYEDNPTALRDAGIAYATEQIIDLLASGVRGIHLYTMNNPYVATKITGNIQSVIDSMNQ